VAEQIFCNIGVKSSDARRPLQRTPADERRYDLKPLRKLIETYLINMLRDCRFCDFADAQLH
jgi:hypothetical protein